MDHHLLPLIPEVEAYHAGDCPFWDDEYISGQMLQVHLNGDAEGASRTFSFMDCSTA